MRNHTVEIGWTNPGTDDEFVLTCEVALSKEECEVKVVKCVSDPGGVENEPLLELFEACSDLMDDIRVRALDEARRLESLAKDAADDAAYEALKERRRFGRD